LVSAEVVGEGRLRDLPKECLRVGNQAREEKNCPCPLELNLKLLILDTLHKAAIGPTALSLDFAKSLKER